MTLQACQKVNLMNILWLFFFYIEKSMTIIIAFFPALLSELSTLKVPLMFEVVVIGTELVPQFHSYCKSAWIQIL